MQPEALDKVDTDALLDVYGEMLGTPSRLLLSGRRGGSKRAARAEAAAQQQQASRPHVAQGAKTLSETDMGADSALTRLLGNLGGGAAAAAPQPGG